MAERYLVMVSEGQSGKIARVFDSQENEYVSCYSRKAFGSAFRSMAENEANDYNASIARHAYYAAHENLVAYAESQDYQRDMEG